MGDAARRNSTRTDGAEPVARRMWRLCEPVHALIYFAPGSLRATADLGPSFWSRYVAQRAAPLGPVPAAVVVAAFGGFAPDRIVDALAGVTVPPEVALGRRLTGIDAAWRELGLPDDGSVREAADLAWEAAQACEDAGRVLGAANRALPRPAEAHLALWQATTTLREHRGDGHLAALAVHGVSPIGSHVLKVLAGESPERDLRLGRRLPDDGWEAALARYSPEEAAALHTAVEDATDRAAAGPWAALGAARTERLAALLAPIAESCWTVVPSPNPVGLTR
ncbi:SCO6745 family protein [Actinomycetospora chiangmaiensis]|uniref:SCO6745 family protein n=1 Tax=Actinomycetospora chiangmaiensis TaxID=402650 RepID=UPI000362EBC3|nr:hypothetical protein [Actinomycetospora chiangmaiensis]